MGDNEREYMMLSLVANRLGLPDSFLRAEAKAGRIPFIQTANGMKFSLEDVRATLRAQAHANATSAANIAKQP